ncbi:MAG: zinc-binding dehydrogenase [Proteobacteria bacterium]|nr:zinc-binding dehydrogenase [Pseudomonadota bacterium]
MKALIFEKPEQPVVRDVEMPRITENEILVRLRSVGICHSDYELLGGRYIIPISYPVTPGHEWCGEIVEIGRNVRNFAPGERVVGECVVRLPDRIHHFGFSLDGADREYFVVRPEWLHKLPDAIDDGTASLIEPFTCGFYAVRRSGGTDASETVVVSGGGTIGLVSAAAAIGMGARVIVIDPISHRRDAALKLGAAAVIDPRDGGTVETVMQMTGGKGADLVVEASGHDASLGIVFDIVREEGRISMVGINIGRQVSSHLGNIQMRNLTVRGCIGSPGVWPDAIRFLERTKLDLSPIRTHEFPLTQSVEAFALGAQADKCIKVTLLNS